MIDSSVHAKRSTFSRRPRTIRTLVAQTSDSAQSTPERITDTAQFELLTSIRGVRPERMQAICNGTAPTNRHRMSLGLAFSDLSEKLLRR